MVAGLDMSLDDIIERSAASRRRAGDLPAGPGPDRRFRIRNTARTTPYSVPQVRQVWRASVVPEMVLDGGVAAAENGTKLYLSNLDYEVSNEDIKLLFSEEGELKTYSIHYDKSGRSKGTAEVVFVRQSDALADMNKYNNMRLDGKPLQIELVGTNLVTPAVIPPFQNSLLGRPNDVPVSGRGRVLGSRFHNGNASGRLPRGRQEKFHTRKISFRDLDDDLERYLRFPGGRGQVKGHIGKLSLKDLDDELERYHLEAMQIKKEKGK